jgi:hypothetical protein
MQPLAQPIADALIHSPGNAAIVIPTGLLGLIPLPAIPMPTDKGSVLDDIGEIHLAPSAGVYAGCRKRAGASTYHHLVGVADPQNSLPPCRAPDPAEDQPQMAAARRYAGTVEPFSSGVYVNALGDEGQTGIQRAYGPGKLARLTALKDHYDPGNAFHLNHNIRPSSG